MAEEYLDVLTSDGAKTGESKPRSVVHREGLFHRAVHVWLYAESTSELLLQKRSLKKDSWPGLWDISSAGHVSAGDSSLSTAIRELEEELGVKLPESAFEFLFEYFQSCKLNGGQYVNKEFNPVYLVTLLEPIPVPALTLQDSEVADAKWMPYGDYEAALLRGDPAYVPIDLHSEYGQLFSVIRARYLSDPTERAARLREQTLQYVPVTLSPSLSHLSAGDVAAINWLVKATNSINDIFLQQVWGTNLHLKKHLEAVASQGTATPLDKLKSTYFNINKSPWSILDENEPFLSTADSFSVSSPDALGPKSAQFGAVSFRASFPARRPEGASFYPQDLSREEFNLWLQTLPPEKSSAAIDFFSVIRRPPEHSGSDSDLRVVPYSAEYRSKLQEASGYLREAANVAQSQSLKTFLWARADALLSNNYYSSDVAWMDLDSPVDVTFGPYETYMDSLFGYKASFEAFIGITDDDSTAKVKLFGSFLQELESNLPEADSYKQKVGGSSPIRVVRLAYTGGDVAGPHVIAYNLPNDERIQKERGTAMVMLKNVSEAKFEHILKPISEALIDPSQRSLVNFDAFYSHTLCHECCHGIGPHSIILPDGRPSTVRQELQELHSALEEAKADIVGLWALRYLLNKGLLPATFEKSMYVSFLAGCFRSIRFGLSEAHGKGQALQFNYLFERGGFFQSVDGSFGVDFDKIQDAVTALSHEILTVQAQGDKLAALGLLSKYGVLTPTLEASIAALSDVDVPVDIAVTFTLEEQLRAIAL